VFVGGFQMCLQQDFAPDRTLRYSSVWITAYRVYSVVISRRNAANTVSHYVRLTSPASSALYLPWPNYATGEWWEG